MTPGIDNSIICNALFYPIVDVSHINFGKERLYIGWRISYLCSNCKINW
jgi:hypothetical protein